jgi:hypothetical protein
MAIDKTLYRHAQEWYRQSNLAEQEARWDTAGKLSSQEVWRQVHDPLMVAVNIKGVIIDLLLALPGYEEQIIERAITRELGGWSIQVCSAEDLIIQKIIAGRARDWLDVEELLIAQYDRLDQVYIEGWLSQFTEALEQPAMLSNYRKLRERGSTFANSQ